MSYYILPKIETNLIIQPSLFNSKDNLQVFVSQSLIKYLNESHSILKQQLGLDLNKCISIKMLNQVVHTYDFLFSVVSGTSSSTINAVIKQMPPRFNILSISWR